MKKKKLPKKDPQSYRERSYRCIQQSGLIPSNIKVMETDLHILAPVDVENEALVLVLKIRTILEEYINKNPLFLTSLEPLPVDKAAAPPLIAMMEAAQTAGVGPMASVAGTVAEYVGKGLLARGLEEVIVENGGDIFLIRKRASTVAIYAGESPLSGKVGVRIGVESMPLGVCCSSGSVGHSLSLGRSDAVVALAASTPLADAVATAVGNQVVDGGQAGVNKALRFGQQIKGVSGLVIISGKHLGAWGDIELESL
ncbi:MAG: UPF0280 family protein [Desulfobulbaceae bacterium]|nr:UPF0280 family protein [Desulfobulbaceae bacterium]